MGRVHTLMHAVAWRGSDARINRCTSVAYSTGGSGEGAEGESTREDHTEEPRIRVSVEEGGSKSASGLEGLATVELCWGKVNAMDLPFLRQLRNTFIHMGRADDVRAVHVRSAHPSVFSAGLDLEEVNALDDDCRLSFLKAVSEAFLAPRLCPKPVAVTIEGHAIAGGMVLGMSSDFLSLGERTRRQREDGGEPHKPPYVLSLPELAVGVPFPREVFEVVRSCIGDGRLLRRMVYGAARLSPQEAFVEGLGDVISDSPEEQSLMWLKKMMTYPDNAFALTKGQMQRDLMRSLRAGVQHGAKAEWWGDVCSEFYLEQQRAENAEIMAQEDSKARQAVPS